MIPKFRGKKELGFINFYNEYDVGDSIQIFSNYITSYKFNLTKAEDVRSKVRVMYDYDYGNDTYRKNTGWHSAKDR